MKHFYAVCIFLLIIIPKNTVFANNQTQFEERKKVGLVLSGGGAKGVAHVGVLKVLEEAGIPIDYIAGTSMGAIVGGLYAAGFDVATLDSLFRAQDWMELLGSRISRDDQLYTVKDNYDKLLFSIPIKESKFRLPTGLLTGQNVYNMLLECTIGYHDPMSFDSLPIPFACVAFDLVSGKDTVLRKGSLPKAIRASMSIPGAFTAIKDKNMVLVDGGLSNNFPVDVAKEMGADLIIGVDVASEINPKDKLDDMPGIFYRILTLMGNEKYRQHLQETDLYIHPSIEPYSSASFTAQAIDSLLLRGEEAARSQWDRILAFKKSIGLPADKPGEAQTRPSAPARDSLDIGQIRFEGTGKINEKTLLRIIGIKPHSRIGLPEIKQAISSLQGTGSFSSISFKVLTSGEQKPNAKLYDVIFVCVPKIRSSLSVGIRMDTDDIASIFVNSVLSPVKYDLNFEFAGRASNNPYAQAGLYYENAFLGKFGVSYKYRYGDISMRLGRDDRYNVRFNKHEADLDLANFYYRNFNFYIGLRYDYFQTLGFLYSADATPLNNSSESILSYRCAVKYESFDHAYHPHRGLNFRSNFALYTDNFVRYHGDSPFFTAAFSIEKAIPAGNRFTVIPAVHSRLIIGLESAYPYKNFIGGLHPGRYIDDQLAFTGLNLTQLVDKQVFIAALEARYKIGNNHYVWLKGNYAHCVNNVEKFLDFSEGKFIVGAALAYSFNSPFGPIDVVFNYSNYNPKKFGFYLNVGKYF